jgi:hypothetical protein
LKLRSGSGSESNKTSGSESNKNLNPDPLQGDKSNLDPHPDPNQRDADLQHCLECREDGS